MTGNHSKSLKNSPGVTTVIGFIAAIGAYLTTGQIIPGFV